MIDSHKWHNWHDQPTDWLISQVNWLTYLVDATFGSNEFFTLNQVVLEANLRELL